jgi:hypothetical protein
MCVCGGGGEETSFIDCYIFSAVDALSGYFKQIVANNTNSDAHILVKLRNPLQFFMLRYRAKLAPFPPRVLLSKDFMHNVHFRFFVSLLMTMDAALEISKILVRSRYRDQFSKWKFISAGILKSETSINRQKNGKKINGCNIY